jgi:lipid A 4'-phosphatase
MKLLVVPNKFSRLRNFSFDGRCVGSCLFVLMLSISLFLMWPHLDLWVTTYFYDGDGSFPANEYWFVNFVYVAVPWLGRLFFFIALAVVVMAIFSPLRINRKQWRRAAAFVTVVVLGVGLLVHSFLKDGMGRPRPRDVQIFAGPTHFVPAFTPSNFCATNCSFVSGHAAVGFSLMSLGMFGTRRRQRFWFVVSVATGSLIGAVRIAQGGHFLSDVLFSFLAIWFTQLLVRSIWLRFRTWQLISKENRHSRLMEVP